MDLEKTMITSASGMRTQSARMRIIAENIANAHSTSMSPGADPYRRKIMTFQQSVHEASGAPTVSINKIGVDQKPFDKRYDPGNPGADGGGYVKMPNVNPLIEMVDMKEAQRSYEANVAVIENAKAMLSRTVDLLR